ncbi:MAG: zinc ribbon domain-containing protein [Euryarchaeota archaeon]|nr:zinc ribbon domain-containing protein [Euryarchaeota archaeon]
MTDAIDIECPNCGKTIRSNVENCPHCHIQLRFLDIKDLEAVAKGYVDEGNESASAKRDESASDGSDSKRFIGKLFGRGRK